MRYFYLAVILSLAIFFGNVSHAQDAEAPAKAPAQAAAAHKYKEVPVDRNGDTKIDGVDVYDEQDRLVKRGYDNDGDDVMDSWETYDVETGMPDVVQDDKEFTTE